jgi:hypothetical protein
MAKSKKENEPGGVYIHPETGDEWPIPENAEIQFNEDGEVLGWSNPTDIVNPLAQDDYEPEFERLSVERRVLGHITDQEHVGRGPRNTVERLAQELAEDPWTDIGFGQEDSVQEYLNDLETHGLIEKRADGTYALTEAGEIELAN